MFCPNCGKELKEGAKFCASCGAQVGDAPAPGGAAGAGNAAPIAGSASASAGSGVMKAKRGKTPFVVGGAVVAAIAVVAVGVLAYNTFFASYEIDEERFPDAAFRSYVSAKCDTDGDGKLSRDEVAAVEYLGAWNADTSTYDDSLDGLGISDLSGIETFTSLKGVSASGNSLTDVDLSSNGALEYVVMDCDSLQYLNVSGANGLQAVQVSPGTEVKGLSDSMVKNTLTKSITTTGDYPGTRSLSYDAYGHLASDTDGTGSKAYTSTLTWDGDKLVVYDDTSFSYDESGRLEEWFEGSQGYRVFYDDQGRMTDIVYYQPYGVEVPEGLRFGSFSYDGDGNITSVSAGWCSAESGSYTPEDPATYTITDDDRASGEVVYEATYNEQGLLTSAVERETWNGQVDEDRCNYEYDGSGNLVKVTSNASTASYEYSYDESGRLASSYDAYNKGGYSYSYNANGLLESVSYESVSYAGSSVKTSYSYSYDDFGNVVSATATSSNSWGSSKSTATYSYLDVYASYEASDYAPFSGKYMSGTGSLKDLCATEMWVQAFSLSPFAGSEYDLAPAFDTPTSWIGYFMDKWDPYSY